MEMFLIEYHAWLTYCTIALSILILVLGIDDVMIDAWYWSKQCCAVLFNRDDTKKQAPSVAALINKAEQPLAIMIPAWMEHDVIARMIENMVSTLDYRQYVMFIGTYANDAATMQEVELMRRRYRHLQRVTVPHDGPTCKADCLNWVIQAIQLYEQQHDIIFAGMIMHDSEDVVHPLELRYFNYLLPQYDMIQLPVIALERRLPDFIAGTYMDDFAEWHTKDLLVREQLSGTIPSAGVGTCFSRRAMNILTSTSDNQPFNTGSLTEDYDIGLRLGAMGMRSHFAQYDVPYQIHRATWTGSNATQETSVTLPLAVREFFPDTLRAAYRQKARWALGIGLQSWILTGWPGTRVNQYFLYRDRKGMITPFITALGYLVLIQLIALYALTAGDSAALPHLVFDTNSIWMTVLPICMATMLVLRISQRMYFVSRRHGWQHGMLSLPRMFVGNLINLLAVSRAWHQFYRHRVYGDAITWDKTMHDFPSKEQLIQAPHRLGEILLSWQVIEAKQLAEALHIQHQHKQHLGQILLRQGWLTEDILQEALSFQSSQPLAHPDAVTASGLAVAADSDLLASK